MNLSKILVIDDNEDDHFFFARAFQNSGINAVLQKGYDADACHQAIQSGEFDCIFLDYILPGVNGLDLLKMVRAHNSKVPIIMLTGQRDHQMIVKFMQYGASDYIQKDNLNSETLRISIENVIRLNKIQQEKLIAQEALRKSEARLAEAQNIALLGNWEYDFNTKQIWLSAEGNRIFENIFLKRFSFYDFRKIVHKEDSYIISTCIDKLKKKPNYDITFRICIPGKEIKFLNAKGHLVLNEAGLSQSIVGTIQDITQLKNALININKAKASKKAKSIVISIALALFILSEALLDPFIDAISTSILLALSFKGGIALSLKPVETFIEKNMSSRFKLNP